MIVIRRLTKKFSKQTLSEVKPAPLSETVDHTLEEGEYTPSQHQAFQPPSPSHSPITSDEEEGEGEESGDEEVLKTIDIDLPKRHFMKHRKCPAPPHRELLVERIGSAEKRKYSQYKCSTDGSSNDSSSDDEVKEAFENCLTASSSPPSWSTDHTHWSSIQRPIRVPSSAGCRKRGPKYFAQMSSSSSSSPVTIERPRLDFNKMQSKRFLMVRKPVVHRHNYHRAFPIMRPSLELSLDFTSHSLFQPVPTPVT